MHLEIRIDAWPWTLVEPTHRRSIMVRYLRTPFGVYFVVEFLTESGGYDQQGWHIVHHTEECILVVGSSPLAS